MIMRIAIGGHPMYHTYKNVKYYHALTMSLMTHENSHKLSLEFR